MVEHDLAKVGVAGSNPVSRSSLRSSGGIGRHAGLKILWALARAGSSPASSTEGEMVERLSPFFCMFKYEKVTKKHLQRLKNSKMLFN